MAYGTTTIADQAEVDDHSDQHHQQSAKRRHSPKRRDSPAIPKGCGGKEKQAKKRQHWVGNTGATEGLKDEAAVDQPHQNQNEAWGQQANRRQKTHRRAGTLSHPWRHPLEATSSWRENSCFERTIHRQLERNGSVRHRQQTAGKRSKILGLGHCGRLNGRHRTSHIGTVSYTHLTLPTKA